MGLVNRVVPTGTTRARAEALAHQLAGFPQLCLRNDRRSVLEQEGALDREFQLGIDSLTDAAAGAERFVDGEGRGGRF